MKRLSTISDKWFYARPHPLFILLGIYIKGDAIVLLPLIFVLLITGFYSLKWMLLGFGVYFMVRNLGEMIYWLLQQFGDKKYRPFDYGLKKLSNNSIYILYQLTSFVGVVVWSLIVIFLVIR